MNKLLAIVLLVLVLPLAGLAPLAQPPQEEDLRYETPTRSAFTALEIWLETGDRPLAAYQIEMAATAGEVRIVGIEGAVPGSVFAEPPYYDPAAMQSERVIIADFSTAAPGTLPAGRFRIATIHLQVVGDIEPAFETKLIVAADADGKAIEAHITTTGPEQDR
jgi:hypothetical protein